MILTPQQKLNDEVSLFDGAVILKGLNGLLEIVGGILLFLVRPETLNRGAEWLTQGELSRDPHDYIATHILHSARALTGHSLLYAALYLLSHGLIKVVLVWGLLKHRLWAYPASIGFLIIFIVYQSYQYGFSRSTGLLLLTIFDAFVLWLIWREYQRLRSSQIKATDN